MPTAADRLEAQLRAVASPERAANEKRYLKSHLEFVGASMGDIRAAVRDVAREQPGMTRDELIALVEELWAKSVHERRMAAVVLLGRFVRLLGPGDVELLERLVRQSRTWALVDALAVDVIGALVGREPDEMEGVLDRWASDGDFWVRRASLLAELRPIRAGASLSRFLRRADPMLEEREFFIRKAIGWVLREAAKRRADDVVAWLTLRTHRASGVTMREAVRYLPVADRERLMDAYRSRTPAD